MRLLELNRVDKYYNSDQVLSDITFSVYKGDILGFLGPNGAGKSTTLKIISGTLQPDSGDVIFDKESIFKKPGNIINRIGYLPETPPIYDYLKVKENLDFFARFRCDSSNRPGFINRSIELCGLSEVINQLAGTLSKGFRQRLGLGIALLGDPDLLILDEPTAGLDPIQIQETRKLIRNLSREKTVLLSSHILSEVSELCNRLVIIHRGKILAEGKTEDLVKDIALNRFILELAAPEPEVMEGLGKIISIEKIRKLPSVKPTDHLKLEIESDSELRTKILKLVSDQEWNLISINKQEPTLENIFLKFVNKDEDEDISDN